MAIPKNIILIIVFVATLFSIALATPGTATFYTNYVRKYLFSLSIHLIVRI